MSENKCMNDLIQEILIKSLFLSREEFKTKKYSEKEKEKKTSKYSRLRCWTWWIFAVIAYKNDSND